jgi:hypothetical protein
MLYIYIYIIFGYVEESNVQLHNTMTIYLLKIYSFWYFR